MQFDQLKQQSHFRSIMEADTLLQETTAHKSTWKAMSLSAAQAIRSMEGTGSEHKSEIIESMH